MLRAFSFPRQGVERLRSETGGFGRTCKVILIGKVDQICTVFAEVKASQSTMFS